MTGTQIAVTAVALTGAAALALWFASKTDPPIIIGDGSVFVSHDSITAANGNKELEAFKAFHKVRTIAVIDRSGSTVLSIPVKDRKWSLTSAGGAVHVDRRSHTFGLGITGTCPSAWQGTGTYFVCSDDKLTPATLTFTDGNCPNTGSASCTLSCPSAYCRLELDYK
jgi:hypothetical protein